MNSKMLSAVITILVLLVLLVIVVISVLPSNANRVFIYNSSGSVVTDIHLVLSKSRNGQFLKKTIMLLPAGEKAFVEFRATDLSVRLEFELGGKKFAVEEEYIDLWIGEGWAFEILQNGSVVAGYDHGAGKNRTSSYWPADKPEVIVTTTPLTLEEARTKLTVALPDNSSNIMFAGYSEFMAYEFYLKFEAPVEVCKKHSQEMIDNYYDRNPGGRRKISLGKLKNIPRINPDPVFGNLAWFDVNKTKKGYQAGTTGHDEPLIIIDSNRGVFYYMLMD